MDTHSSLRAQRAELDPRGVFFPAESERRVRAKTASMAPAQTWEAEWERQEPGRGATRALPFESPAPQLAHALIGAWLLVDGIGGLIVETEAYDANDPASHAYGGPTSRNAAMFGPPGRVYVYRSYGLHWCLNFTCEPEGHGAGVLIRAIEPRFGLSLMRKRRDTEDARLLCSGPGRLCQALGVDMALYGKSLAGPPFFIEAPAQTFPVASGPRVGISRAQDVPWRFALAGSRFLSKPMPASLE